MKLIINKIIIEPEKEHLSTMFFLHGLGYNSWLLNISFIFLFIREKFPHTKFVFPLAALKSIEVDGLEIVSPTNAWYSMNGDLSKIQKEIPLEEVDKWIKINKNELLKMNMEIDELIQQEINAGISSQKIIVAGHSQGGSMTLAVGLTSKHFLGGIICMSGFLPFSQKELNKLSQINDKKTPILICHGEQDTIVPYWLAKKSAEILKVEPHGYPNLGHLLISNELFEDAVRFSKNIFCEKEINFNE